MGAIFESVEDVWLVWAISLLLIGFCTRRLFSRFRFANLGKFHRSEAGASYALPYVMTFVCFMFLMALFLQASLMLVAKFGTMYSAHAACRSYVVWQTADPEDVSILGFNIKVDAPKILANRAAVMAMVPFASCNRRHRRDLYPASTAPIKYAADSFLYRRVYERTLATANEKDKHNTHGIIKNPRNDASKEYMQAKYFYAGSAVKVTLPESKVKWNDDVKVKVTYRMPFHIPGTARMLGGSSSGFGNSFYRDLESTVIMPSEAAKTPDGQIGIPYSPSILVEAIN